MMHINLLEESKRIDDEKNRTSILRTTAVFIPGILDPYGETDYRVPVRSHVPSTVISKRLEIPETA